VKRLYVERGAVKTNLYYLQPVRANRSVGGKVRNVLALHRGGVFDGNARIERDDSRLVEPSTAR